jgi:hypothetical protein
MYLPEGSVILPVTALLDCARMNPVRKQNRRSLSVVQEKLAEIYAFMGSCPGAWKTMIRTLV